MTKAELIAKVQEVAGQSHKATGEVVDAVFAAVGDAIKADGRFSYPGFGTFNVKERAARAGRNPKTGKTIKIAARKVVVFKAAPGLKDRL